VNYYCPNNDCAIHQKGKPFPTKMDCPLCDTELIARASYSEEEVYIINSYPYVIAYPFEQMLLEDEGRNKLELLAYTFLNGMKFWGLVIASEYFQSPLKSAKINEHFRNNLYQPSYGNWNGFLRETITVLDKENVKINFPEFIKAYKEIETGKSAPKYKAESPYTNEDGQIAWKKSELTAIGALINFRNRYLGHGLPLSKQEYSNLFNTIYPVLLDFLKSLLFTAELQLIRHEGDKHYLLKGTKVLPMDSREKLSIVEAQVLIQDGKERHLNLLPFYILPKQFISGVDKRAEVMIYEQNTGSRVVFFSPESIKAEESGPILERIQLLIQEKEKTAPCSPEEFTRYYVQQWTAEHNEKTLAGLKREKKVLEGIYQNRMEAENVLSTWFEAESSLLAVSADAGSGKTNLLAYMHSQYEKLGLPSLFIRAARCNAANWEDILRAIWNASDTINLTDFVASNYHSRSPIMVLVDGGNEHHSPIPFLESICEFLQSIPAGSMKVVLSWRSATVGQMPAIPDSMASFVYSVTKRDEQGILAINALRLVGMNKLEIEGAWNKYFTNKNFRCKPNFEFADLIVADSSLVEELSNPLLLRMFMELFHAKGLPKSSKGTINLWALWWSKVEENQEEADYLKDLSRELIKRQSLQISLDDLFDHPTLGESAKNIQIDSPHQQVLRKGIISQYFIDDTLQVAFTMEAALYYVASLDIHSDNLETISLNRGMWQESIKFFIWRIATSDNNEILFEKADDKDFPSDLLVKGLAESLICHGTTSTLEKLLSRPSARDFEILGKSMDLLSEKRPGEREQRATEILQHLLMHDVSLNSVFILKLMERASKTIADEAYGKLLLAAKDWIPLELLGFAKYCSRFGQYRQSSVFLSKAWDRSISEPWLVREEIMEHWIEISRALGNYVHSLQLIADLEEYLHNENKWDDFKDAKLSNIKGMVYGYLSKYIEANNCYWKALKVFEKLFGLYDERTISTLRNIGDVAKDLAKYDQALEVYDECQKRYQKVFGLKHTNIAGTKNKIGQIWGTKGQYDKALEYFEKALTIYIHYNGESHPIVAVTLNLIGDVWNTKGQYDKALEYFEKALTIFIHYYGESHHNVAATLIRIGYVWNTKGQYDKALEYFEKSLTITIHYYGESHPNAAFTLNRIGEIWNTKGQYVKALEYFEKTLTIYIHYYGESHPNVAVTLNHIGGVWKTKGQYNKALEYFEKALTIYIYYKGESHPDVAFTLNRIGEIWNTKGQYDKALEYFEKTLTIFIHYYGESHPNVAVTLNLIGEIWKTKGQYDKALEYFQKALTIYIEYYGESHPKVAFTLNRIGDVWDAKGQYDKTLEYFEKALTIYIHYKGESHPDVEIILNRIGEIGKTKGLKQ